MREVFLIGFFLSVGIFLSLKLQAQSATAVVQKADEKMRGKTSVSQIIFKTIRPGWSRDMRVQVWASGNDRALLLIQSPVKEKGVAFLKRKKEVWNWLPTLERVIKLPPSMMSQSWMGTDFTNDDLVRESSVVLDYSHRFLRDTVVDGKSCYQIECVPLPQAAVVWGKLQIGIDKTEFLEMFVRFYDEEGQLVNTMQSYDIKRMDGRLIPTRVEMIPADKKGQKTVIQYESVLFDRTIPDDWFTLEKLKQLH